MTPECERLNDTLSLMHVKINIFSDIIADIENWTDTDFKKEMAGRISDSHAQYIEASKAIVEKMKAMGCP